MKSLSHNILLLVIVLISIPITYLAGQEFVSGYIDSIRSETLNETRKLYIRLPGDYDISDKSYRVFYRLDGEPGLFMETIGVIHRLVEGEKVIHDMILVMIENTNRDRDMWPVKTEFLPFDPGADRFKEFFKSELISYIDSKYRTSGERILCGQSVSSVFTLYSFLSDPALFDSYISCSAGFPGCEKFFIDKAKEFQISRLDKITKVFLTNGKKDPLDPEGNMDRQISHFVKILEPVKNLSIKYVTYDDEGHVPYPSVYHGMKYFYTEN